MAEELNISPTLDKESKYKQLLPQINSLIEGEKNLIANLANVAAALKQTFNFFWVGFYLVENQQLVLGPFQGSIACTRINYGNGVCGTAWKEQKTILVDDVDKFPGHITCSSLSRSEIVVPVFNKNNVVTMVLDIDSDKLSDFDLIDKKYLEELAAILKKQLHV
ncbi:MAG: GAF domain-containing protein [Bacteroidia bacterium]